MATDDKELLLNSDKDRDPSGMVELTETLVNLRYFAGASKLNENLKEFYAPPQRQKSCSYLK
uniref:FH2 domain-containing protein n=1 Tax=Angiostrongylus cantonensis TaxID=6313 RepID=A0A0K0D7E8_ANGCA